MIPQIIFAPFAVNRKSIFLSKAALNQNQKKPRSSKKSHQSCTPIQQGSSESNFLFVQNAQRQVIQQVPDLASPQRPFIPKNWLNFYRQEQQQTQKNAVVNVIFSAKKLDDTPPPIVVKSSVTTKATQKRIRPRENSVTLIKQSSENPIKKIVIEKSMLRFITAKSFIIMCENTQHVIYSRKCHKEREIASLTKILTCLIACRVIEQNKIDPANFMVYINRRAAVITGTSANLRAGDQLSLLDLLHGIMLPSGNDAAYAVAETIGRQIKKDDNTMELTPQQSVRVFLAEMNKLAHDLNLRDSNYANPHGLANIQNYSSAYDQAILIVEAMKNELFATIVKTQNYRCTIRNQRSNTTRDANWENTNKLLSRKDCVGVKTGNTPIAGSCLAANFHNNNQKLIIVLLKAAGVEERFTEMIHLYEYTKRKLA